MPHPFVDALVVAANQQQALLLRQLRGYALVENATLGREQDDRPLILRADFLDRAHQHVGPQDHAAAAAARGIVHLAPAPLAPVAQIMQTQVQQAAFLRLPHHAQTHRPLEHLREKGQHVDLHGGPAWKLRRCFTE